MIRILGIDPGSLALGWAIVDCDPVSRVIVLRRVDVITLRAGDPLLYRLAKLTPMLDKLLDQRPTVRMMAVEQVGFLGKHARAALALGMVRGLAVSAAARAEVELRELAIGTVKKSATGWGNASKPEVAAALRLRFGTRLLPEDLPGDATDAVAVAVAAATIECEAA